MHRTCEQAFCEQAICDKEIGSDRLPGLRRGLRTLAGALLLVLSELATAASADPTSQLLAPSLAPMDSTRAAAITVEEATRRVREATGGRVVKAIPSMRQGKRGITVRVLIDGSRVVTYFVDDDGNVRGR
ncbi:MAG: hypothetical protein AAF648_12360 [Pseudomonadota bacterium]